MNDSSAVKNADLLEQGYVLDEHNVRCVNIDECAIMHGVCGNGTCIDVPGSFTCKCDPGIQP